MVAGYVRPPGEEAASHLVPKVRCLRCNAVIPESELGAHRRLHGSHGPFAADWSLYAIDEEAPA